MKENTELMELCLEFYIVLFKKSLKLNRMMLKELRAYRRAS